MLLRCEALFNASNAIPPVNEPSPITETKTETYQEPVYRDEPIYETKYYYEIDKWLHKEYIKTSGNDKEPVWGEYTLKDKERENGRTERYLNQEPGFLPALLCDDRQAECHLAMFPDPSLSQSR